MLGPIPFLVLGVLLVAAIAVAGVRVWNAFAPEVAVGDHPGLVRLRRIAVISRLLGLLAGVATPFVLARVGRLGQGLVLVPTVVGAVLVAATLAAELVGWRDARGGAAALEVRRVRDHLPVRTGIAALVALVVLLATAGWTTAVADPDDLGRAGRSYAYRCVGTGGCDTGSFGPFPGSFYTLPMLVGLALLLVLAVITAVVAVRRPRDGADPEIRRVDDRLRSSAVRTVVGAVLLASAGSLTGIGFVAANGLLAQWSELGTGPRTAGVLLQAAGVLGLGLLVWSAITLLTPLLDRGPAAGSVLRRTVRAR